MTLCRPGTAKGILGLILTIISGVLVNVFRIVVMATGLVYPELFMNIDVMEAPWHDLLGLVFLAIGCLPVTYWAYKVYNQKFFQNNAIKRKEIYKPLVKLNPLLKACVFLILAVTIISLPRKPIDVAIPNITVELPPWINGNTAIHVGLLSQERLTSPNTEVRRPRPSTETMVF